MNDEEMKNNEESSVAEVKYQIITLQDEAEKCGDSHLLKDLNKEIEQAYERFATWCKANRDSEKYQETKQKLLFELNTLIEKGRALLVQLKENEELNSKLVNGKEKALKIANQVKETVDGSVQEVLNHPAVAQTIDTVSDKIVDFIQDDRVQESMVKVRKGTLKVAQSAFDGLKKVLKADELDD